MLVSSKNNVPTETKAAVAAGALPAASLAQYATRYADSQKSIKKAKELKTISDLRKKSKTGDIVIQGGLLDVRHPAGKQTGMLATGSRYTGGSSLYHGAVVAEAPTTRTVQREIPLPGNDFDIEDVKIKTKRKVFVHGGAITPADPSGPILGKLESFKDIRRQRIEKEERARLGAAEEKKPLKERAKKFKDDLKSDLKETFKPSKEQVKARMEVQTPKGSSMYFDRNVQGKLIHSRLDKSRGTVLLTPKIPHTKAERDLISKTVIRESVKPYAVDRAALSGIKSVLMPSLPGTKKSCPKVKGGISLPGHHCGSLPATVAKTTGRGLPGSPSGILPARMLNNPNYEIAGVYNKAQVLKDNRRVFRGRVALGLAATGATAGAAYAIAKSITKKKGSKK